MKKDKKDIFTIKTIEHYFGIYFLSENLFEKKTLIKNQILPRTNLKNKKSSQIKKQSQNLNFFQKI